MRLFLTGGTGFVGRNLLDLLLAEGNPALSVDVLCRNPRSFLKQFPIYGKSNSLRFVQGDILGGFPVPSALGYTHVIHAAADTHSTEGTLPWIRQIVDGTENVLKLAKSAGAHRFLYISSGAVYGPQPADLLQIPETYLGAPDPLLAGSVYGQAKRIAEQICFSFNEAEKFEVVSARCFAFSGKHLPLDGPYAFGNFVRDALHSPTIRVKGDGSAVRSYLDSGDMAAWLLGLLKSGKAGQAYNVGSDQPINMRDLALLIRDELAPEKEVVIEGLDKPDISQRSVYVPDIQKARDLGLKIKTSLRCSVGRLRGC